MKKADALTFNTLFNNLGLFFKDKPKAKYLLIYTHTHTHTHTYIYIMFMYLIIIWLTTGIRSSYWTKGKIQMANILVKSWQILLMNKTKKQVNKKNNLKQNYIFRSHIL